MSSLLKLQSIEIASLDCPGPIEQFCFFKSLEENKKVARSICFLESNGHLQITKIDESTLFAVIVGNFASIKGIETGQVVLDLMASNPKHFKSQTKTVCYPRTGRNFQPLDNKDHIFVYWLLISAIICRNNLFKMASEMLSSIAFITKTAKRSFSFDKATFEVMRNARQSILHILPILVEPFFVISLPFEQVICEELRFHVKQKLIGYKMEKFDIIDKFLNVPQSEKTKAHIEPQIMEEIERYEKIKATMLSELCGTNIPLEAYYLFNPFSGYKLRGTELLYCCAYAYKTLNDD